MRSFWLTQPTSLAGVSFTCVSHVGFGAALAAAGSSASAAAHTGIRPTRSSRDVKRSSMGPPLVVKRRLSPAQGWAVKAASPAVLPESGRGGERSRSPPHACAPLGPALGGLQARGLDVEPRQDPLEPARDPPVAVAEQLHDG